MSKFTELEKRAEVAANDIGEVVAKFQVEADDLDKEFDKLIAEFERKVKAPFRGIHVTVIHDESQLSLNVGVEGLFLYREDNYYYSDDLITRATADKLKALYIEYYGEL